MFSFIKRLFRQLIRRSTYIQHESINKSSIIILILVDIFVLFNVFNGLNNIAQLPLSPQEEFPCFSAHERYQNDKQKGNFDFNTATIESIIAVDSRSLLYSYDMQRSRLGKVAGLCENVSRLSKQINTTENIKLKASINQDRKLISRLNQEGSSGFRLISFSD